MEVLAWNLSEFYHRKLIDTDMCIYRALLDLKISDWVLVKWWLKSAGRDIGGNGDLVFGPSEEVNIDRPGQLSSGRARSAAGEMEALVGTGLH